MVRVLNVAEKPSVAKELTEILGNHRVNKVKKFVFLSLLVLGLSCINVMTATESFVKFSIRLVEFVIPYTHINLLCMTSESWIESL